MFNTRFLFRSSAFFALADTRVYDPRTKHSGPETRWGGRNPLIESQFNPDYNPWCFSITHVGFTHSLTHIHRPLKKGSRPALASAAFNIHKNKYV